MMYQLRHGNSFYHSFPLLVLLCSHSEGELTKGVDWLVMAYTYYVMPTWLAHMVYLHISCLEIQQNQFLMQEVKLLLLSYIRSKTSISIVAL